MVSDYIPDPDGDFYVWEQNFLRTAGTDPAAVGITAEDVTALGTARDAWEAAYLDNETRQAAARAARQLKDDTRRAFESAIRAVVKRIQAAPIVTDDQRRALGITVKDAVATSAPAAATRPVAVVSTAQRLRHEIRFYDEATPTRKARPAGTMGCEIWVKLAAAGEAPPADEGDCTFLALDTASPYTAEYSGEESGKTAHYLLRWVSTRGEKGPWSETVSATVAG